MSWSKQILHNHQTIKKHVPNSTSSFRFFLFISYTYIYVCVFLFLQTQFPANNSGNDIVGASLLAMEISIRGVIGVSNSMLRWCNIYNHVSFFVYSIKGKIEEGKK